MGATIAEKILSQHAGKKVEPGELVVAKVDFCFGQDGTSGIIINRIKELNAKSLAASSRFCMVIDHNAPSPNEKVSEVHAKMRDFARRRRLKLYDVGCGVCHQVIPEQGHIAPGDLVIGADSHTCTYGALGALATGVGSTDLAITLATGRNWFKVPETIKIIVNGKLPAGVFAKDVILKIIGKLRANGATYKSIEFTGALIKALSVDARMTIANMAVEMGAKCGIMEQDEKTFAWLKQCTNKRLRAISADRNAHYSREIEFDMNRLSPQVAKPHAVDNVVDIEQIEGTRIDEAFIGTCTNGRLEDLKVAAAILKGKKAKRGVRLIVASASRAVFLAALARGYINTFIDAGASVLPPGCGPCVGTQGGIPAEGETVLSCANRNFKGRMGNPNAFIYLASPATVAASAIHGAIRDPRKEFAR